MIVSGELLALLFTVTVPEKIPVPVGENSTLRVADCPDAIVAPETPLPTIS